MKVEAVINSLLTADATLVGLVGTNIYPVVAPEQAVDRSAYIVYSTVSNVQQRTMDAAAAFKLYKARIQVTCASKDYPSLKTITQAVRNAVNAKRGTIAGTLVVVAQLANEGPDDFDSGSRMYVQPIDFFITYHE